MAAELWLSYSHNTHIVWQAGSSPNEFRCHLLVWLDSADLSEPHPEQRKHAAQKYPAFDAYEWRPTIVQMNINLAQQILHIFIRITLPSDVSLLPLPKNTGKFYRAKTCNSVRVFSTMQRVRNSVSAFRIMQCLKPLPLISPPNHVNSFKYKLFNRLFFYHASASHRICPKLTVLFPWISCMPRR